MTGGEVVAANGGRMRQWRAAQREDVGLVARFADRSGDHWSYGLLVDIEPPDVDDVFSRQRYGCLHVDGDDIEPFYICEVQDFPPHAQNHGVPPVK